MKIKIDKEKCIGCQSCASICSEVFEMGDDGKAQVKKDADLKAKCIDDAVKSCAVEAISMIKKK